MRFSNNFTKMQGILDVMEPGVWCTSKEIVEKLRQKGYGSKHLSSAHICMYIFYNMDGIYVLSRYREKVYVTTNNTRLLRKKAVREFMKIVRRVKGTKQRVFH